MIIVAVIVAAIALLIFVSWALPFIIKGIAAGVGLLFGAGAATFAAYAATTIVVVGGLGLLGWAVYSSCKKRESVADVLAELSGVANIYESLYNTD